MKQIKEKPGRLDINFLNECNEIIRSRTILNKENPRKPNGTRRITKALTKLSYWHKIKQDLIDASWEEDRWKK